MPIVVVLLSAIKITWQENGKVLYTYIYSLHLKVVISDNNYINVPIIEMVKIKSAIAAS